MIDPKELADRCVAVWIEPDAERRRKHITQLWAEDGVHVLQPPQEVRQTAATLGMIPTLKARGHDALQVRVTRSYQQFIAPGEFTLRARDNATSRGDVVKFNWEMEPRFQRWRPWQPGVHAPRQSAERSPVVTISILTSRPACGAAKRPPSRRKRHRGHRAPASPSTPSHYRFRAARLLIGVVRWGWCARLAMLAPAGQSALTEPETSEMVTNRSSGSRRSVP